MKRVFTPPRLTSGPYKGNSNGHKVFVDDNGKVLLADDSGSTPSQTDDGPLVVDTSKAITLTIHRDNLTAIIPVLCVRNDNASGSVWTTPDTAKAVLEHAKMVVGIDKSAGGALEAIHMLLAMGVQEQLVEV